MHVLVRRNAADIGLLALALGVSALFIFLGMWQLDRAGQKRATLAEFESRGMAEQVDLNQVIPADAGSLSGYRAAATGHYIGRNKADQQPK